MSFSDFNRKKISSITLGSLCILSLANTGVVNATNTINNLTPQQKAKNLAVGFAFVYSVYTHLVTTPWVGESRYSAENLKNSLFDVVRSSKRGFTEFKERLAQFKQEVMYFYKDGICGHKYVCSSPKEDRDTKVVSITEIPCRGLYGYIRSYATNFMLAAAAAKIVQLYGKSSLVELKLRLLNGDFAQGLDPNAWCENFRWVWNATQDELQTFLDSNPSNKKSA